MIIEATFGIAILLAAGLLAAKLAQLLRLPSVTGFILAGLLLGSSGLGIITVDMMGDKLEHFTQIALMLIAFGIGEHVELRRLGNVARDVAYISIIQAVAAFILVMGGVLAVTWFLSGVMDGFRDQLILSLLLGAIAVATAPAATLHVVRELGARGPFTSTLMAVVAVDDGIAIIIFGLAISTAHQLAGTGGAPLQALLYCGYEIIGSVFIGIITGFLLDIVLHKLHNRGEMLTAGLALLLLCGEITHLLHLSSLLAGMMAGFIVINRAERDVRLFRVLNGFEPPIYVLFFTLAGVHLDIHALKLAGWVGVIYFFARVAGKYFGSWIGAYLAGSSKLVRDYLGLALLPQAGVAIGLVFIVSTDAQLSPWSTIVTPVVLAGVVLSELFGPLLARITIEKSGEGTAPGSKSGSQSFYSRIAGLWLGNINDITLEPWNDKRLQPAASPSGVVLFGAYHVASVRALARIATILADHFNGLPMSARIHVRSPKEACVLDAHAMSTLFLPETDEAELLGYPMQKKIICDHPTADLIGLAEQHNAQAVILGYPPGRNPRAFHKVLDQVSSQISCPLVAVRFVGTMAWKRILVPFLFPEELDELLPILEGMASDLRPRITFLHLLYADTSREEVHRRQLQLREWADETFFDIETRNIAQAVESRLETILQETEHHDLIIMTAARRTGMKRAVFGSLACSVVRNCRNPVFVVYPGIRLNRKSWTSKNELS